MLYAILAYHVEAEVMSWTPEEDAALMTDLLQVHDRLNAEKAARAGGAARRDGGCPHPARSGKRNGARWAVCRNQRAIARAVRGELH